MHYGIPRVFLVQFGLGDPRAICLFPRIGPGRPHHMNTNAPKLVHIEDDAWSVQIVRELVRHWPEIEHAGAAVSAAEGAALCRQTRPAIALIDLRLPDGDGFSLGKALRQLPHPPRLIFLTARKDDAALFALSRDPSLSLLWKSPAINDHLRPAVAEALAGRAYQPPEVRANLLRLRRDPLAFFKILADAELELLPLFGRGLSDQDIAAATGRSAFTIKWRRHQIMRKLDLHRATDLMRWARQKGFADEGAPPCPPAG